jgi:hypothetical protein
LSLNRINLVLEESHFFRHDMIYLVEKEIKRYPKKWPYIKAVVRSLNWLFLYS